jgi:hypothetical protein
MAGSLSHTSAFGTAFRPDSSSQWPLTRSAACLDGSIRAVITREYPDTITSTGGRPVCPKPSGMSAGGNHRSHWASSPG